MSKQTPRTDNAMRQMTCFANHPAVQCLSDLARTIELENAELLAALEQILCEAEEREDIEDREGGPGPSIWMRIAEECRAAIEKATRARGGA